MESASVQEFGASGAGAPVFDYQHLEFRYRPFPIGYAKPIMEEGAFRALHADYPPIEIFENIPKLGNKYSLSERFGPRAYADWINSRLVWREFHRWLKSEAFIDEVLAVLKQHHIDLGYRRGADAKTGPGRVLKELLRGQIGGASDRLSTRFEFSMLPADGGHILPHTDGTAKIVTLIISMIAEDEWDPAFGGGTDLNQPKDPRLDFNRLNNQAGFEEMEVLHTYPFEPNQAVIFVKTFNSWHSVRPMTGAGSPIMRKTLTINIEKMS